MIDEQFFRKLLDISRQMAQTRVVEPLLQYAMGEALKLVGAENGHIILRNPDGSFDFRVSLNHRRQVIPQPETQISRTILNKTLKDNTPLVLRDASNDKEFNGESSVSLLELRSVMCVPLTTYRKTIGAIYVENRSAAAVFQDQDIEPLSFFAAQAAVFIENAMLNENLEHQVCLHTQEIQKNKANLQALIENTQDSIWSVDRDYRIVIINSTFTRHFKRVFGVELMPGMQILKHIPDEDLRQRWKNRYDHAFQGETLGVEDVHEVNGKKHFYDISISPIIRKNGRISGATAFSRDMTEHQHVAEALQRAKEAAESANQAKSAFLANMSHELRTPLNSILGFAQLIARNPNIPASEHENLNIIQRSGEHLLTLINQVLDLSKIEAGRLTLHETPFNLYWLLDDLEDMFSLKAENKGLHLSVSRQPALPQYVCADEVKLRQVLINLLSNAIKFTDAGGVTLRVVRKPGAKSREQKTRCEVGFEIEDTGPGITPEEITKLFDAFTQIESDQHEQEGTGLGLTISQKFVHLMRGDIVVESEPGAGSRFRFSIPMSITETAGIAEQQAAHCHICSIPNAIHYRILIVDDKADNRRILVQFLAPFGFTLQEASNGEEALQCYKYWKPHLVWMDVRMPKMDGYTATKHIRACEVARHHDVLKGKTSENTPERTIIIAVSANSFEGRRGEALLHGCDDFLSKPFRECEVFNLLQKHLNLHYVYETSQHSSEARKLSRDAIPPEALLSLSPALQQDLLYAVETLDLEVVHKVIEQIRPHNPMLADMLAGLIQDYRFDLLQKALTRIEGS